MQPSRASVTSAFETMNPWRMKRKILAGRTDVNIPALLTKDVKGG
jgi:hypothetical protein